MKESQFMVLGTRSSFSGRARPCGQMGRSVKVSTLRTSPISPFQIHSQILRTPSPEAPWLPIWVATLYFAASLVSRRDSYTV